MKMKARNFGSKSKEQSGFVAIFTTLIIMGILTLLTIGFSFATRQAQRRTLDDQLNAQAFYAAESGINLALTQLDVDSAYAKPDCGPDPIIPAPAYTIDAATNVRITCLLVDSSPPSIKHDNVPKPEDGEPIFFRSQLPGPDGLESLTISWDHPTTVAGQANAAHPFPAAYSDNNSFLPDATWGSRVGMVRIDIIPASSLSRADLVNNSYTFFLYPNPNGPSTVSAISPGPANQGAVLTTPCTNNANSSGYRCAKTIQLTGTGSDQLNYYLRLQAYYDTVKTEIEFFPTDDGSGPVIKTTGGQAVIDATGESNGVFRRVQVHVPIDISGGYNPPLALFTADTICKRFVTSTSGSQLDSANPACDIFNY